jgi:hypothetical protein
MMDFKIVCRCYDIAEQVKGIIQTTYRTLNTTEKWYAVMGQRQINRMLDCIYALILL